MPSPPPLQPNVYYHIYNRGINRENVFIEERNYRHFLRLYAKHIEPIAETYAYCLLKNHFHFLVRIKEIDPKGFQKPLGSASQRRTASDAFSNFFNAYAKAINKACSRTGSLFQHPFGRKSVDTHAYLMQLVRYIHFNPQKHRLVSDFREWPYSSYHAHLSRQATHLCRAEVLGWFGDVKNFKDAHTTPFDEAALVPLVSDDFD